MSEQTLSSLDENIEMENNAKKSPVKTEGSMKYSKKIILQIANLSYCWFATIFVYYGLNLNSVYLEYWDKYINFIVRMI